MDRTVLRGLAVQTYQSCSGLSRFVPALLRNDTDGVGAELAQAIAKISAEANLEILRRIYAVCPEIENDLSERIDRDEFVY